MEAMGMLRPGPIVALFVAAVVTATAQQPPVVFISGVQTVPLFATVTDATGRLIPDLAKEDFEILDNNKPQTVISFANDVQSIKVVVMLDESGSMVNNIATVKDGAEQFLLRLLPDDRARIGSFEDKMIVSPEFTGNRSELVQFLKDKLQYGNGTRLWDAVDFSMTALSALDGRRVVLVFTDGGDDPGPGKHVSYGTVLKRAQNEGYMVYAIGFHSRCRGGSGGRMIETDPDPSLKKIAAESGGGYFELKEGMDLSSTFTRVARGSTASTSSLRRKRSCNTLQVRQTGMTARAQKLARRQTNSVETEAGVSGADAQQQGGVPAFDGVGVASRGRLTRRSACGCRWRLPRAGDERRGMNRHRRRTRARLRCLPLNPDARREERQMRTILSGRRRSASVELPATPVSRRRGCRSLPPTTRRRTPPESSGRSPRPVRDRRSRTGPG